MSWLPVAAPALRGRERDYVLDCLEKNQISGGEYVTRFEAEFAEFCNAREAVACCNGTVALHLALTALGVGPGDEVILPTLTFVATANAVAQCGAVPVLVDVDPESWCIDPREVAGRVTANTKGIIAVHLYGHPAEMDELNAIAERYGLFVLEDAAEAHGAMYKGKRVGGLGRAGCFSFYGNKILTMGEGGAVVTNDEALAAKLRTLRGQGVDPERRYWFPVRGFNYRLTNLQAAIGLAQVEQAEWHLQQREIVANWYRRKLWGVPGLILQPEAAWSEYSLNAHWMVTVLVTDARIDRDRLMARLAEQGIETRPVFYPMHQLPMYAPTAKGQMFPVADWLAARGLNLPTYAEMSKADVERVCTALVECLNA